MQKSSTALVKGGGMSPSRRTTKGSSDADVNWPTLEEQFASAQVVAGTALEQLIRDNQDFGMLKPSEATDTWRVPPWLRVYYRKRHPNGSYSGPSPTNGYPHSLGDTYDWMVRHQDLPGKSEDG
jgi:hypothetical protein